MDLVKLKNKIESQKSERDKLLGQKDLLMDKLHDLGYKTINAASKDILKMEKEIQDMERELYVETEAFEEKYSDLI